ncbi:MAG TPA: CoA transferase [Candidatus Acidoferrales bacterium]|nr:CoA transferase [Candidatus Acidoferrales bacterium]
MRYNSLSDIRVVDLTHYIAGPYATRLLGDMGADVIKVEPPAGEGGRRAGPYRDDGRDGQDRGGMFAFLNLNKRGVTLNLKHQRGRELMMNLLRDADLLVENFAPGTLAAMGLAPDALRERFPRLSIISISNFGQDGPDRDAALNDLVLYARGGWTYPVGERTREPLTPPGSLAQYVAALYAAIAALQTIAARDMGLGRGQHVDISILEATVATMIYETVTFQYSGILRQRAGKRFAVGPFMIVTLKCKDGYAGLHCVTDKQFEGVCDLMGRRELASDPRFASALNRYANNDALLQIVEAFFLEHERKWLYREGQRRAIPLVPIPSVAEVLEWEQTKARNYFETIDDPVLGPIRLPGAPLRLTSHRAQPSRPAPRLGEHNREIFGQLLGVSDGEIKALQQAGTI